MLTLWKPNRMTNLERLFDDFFETKGLDKYYENNFSPNIDIRETKDEVIVEAELAGMDRKDVKVSYEDGALKISGEKKDKREEKDDKYHVVERSYGAFQRAVPINENYIHADKIEANFKNGILTINIPKKEETKKSKEIEVKVS